MNGFEKVTQRINSTFTAEPSLVGEVVEVDAVATQDLNGRILAKLLGDSHYIITRTDGYVLVKPSELEDI